MWHELKINPEYMMDVVSGYKNFEVRKDDRGFQLGDVLTLQEFVEGEYTGFETNKKIEYILGRKENEKKYVAEGYVILGIRDIGE